MAAPAPSARTTVRRLPARAAYERATIDAILGTAAEVTDPAERLAALEAIVEHVVPGRWREVRGPSERELKLTKVLSLPIAEASAKVRTGGPLDDEEDLGWPCWAGVLPLGLVPLAPVPDARLAAGIAVPMAIASYRRVTGAASSDRASGSDGG